VSALRALAILIYDLRCLDNRKVYKLRLRLIAMKIIIKKVSDVKPDKEQPRKTFEQEKLKFLAESILSNGLLIPIEIDENNVITDGERRWRAHKLAKVKEIECRVVKVKDKTIKLRRQLVVDIQDEEIPTGERYEAIMKLWRLECPTEKYSSAVSADWCKGIGINLRFLRTAFEYVSDKEKKPDEMKGFSASTWGQVRALPKEEREEIKKELKDTEEPIKKIIQQKKEELQTKKQLEELKKKNKEIKDAKKWEVKVTTTKDVLNDIRDGIFSTHKELNNLMFRIRKVRRTKLYLYKPKDKENFLKVVDSSIGRARKWADELEQIREDLELEIVRE